jgi:hypothetical protein
MAFIGGLPFSPLMGFGGLGFGGGLGGCCDGLLGSQGGGALAGGLTGGLAGLLFSGGNPLGALVGGGIGAAIGGLIGRHHHHHHHHHCHCQPQFPPPYGGGYGGPGLGGYGGGFGPGFPGAFPGGYGQQGFYPQGAYGAGYQQGFQAAQYQQGYQAGYQAGMGYGPQQGYPGCFPPGGGWNNGCCPSNQCFPPRPGSTGNPGGHLCQEEPGKPINYTTSGGWRVQVNGDKVIITDPTGKQKIENSGDPHEYVDGKHVKDWEGKQRSIVLPDGTKVTMSAPAANGVIEHTSIYDGDQNVQIQNKGNEVTSRSFDPYDTRMREAYQYDGETARVSYNRDGGINYTNLYTQDENFGMHSNYKEIASTNDPKWWERPLMPFFGAGQQRVHDYYNDPRLLFT